MDRRKWCVSNYDSETVQTISEMNELNPYTALLLSARGITGYGDVRDFCTGDNGLIDPFMLPDMEKAVETIINAIENDEKIAVYGDYDADGLTATTVLYTYLVSQGADVVYYVPDRNTEGYGMNIPAIDKINAMGVKLIITVDNGISSIKEAEYIGQLGIKLVITDHHTVPNILPKAEAVVNPHRADCICPFHDWAGVGVAFKLICALEGDCDGYMLDEYAQLVAIGTIADVVPLVGENRTIVRRGIELMNSEPLNCIDAMKAVDGTEGKPMNATGIAFTICPRINAMGRIGSVQPVLDFLTENGDLMRYAEMLNDSNRERQRIEQEILDCIKKILKDDCSPLYEPVIIIENSGWHAGVVGIVAARIAEKYSKPCLIISVDGQDAKGSGRSIEGFSIYDALAAAQGHLTHFGGHTLAVGFSLKTENIAAFKKSVNDYARNIKMPYARLMLDCKLRPEALTLPVQEAFCALEPFGAGNPQPLVGVYSVTLKQITPLSNGKHLRLGFIKNGISFTALRFGVSEDKFQYEVGDVLDLAVRLEENEYRNERKVSVQIKAIRPAGRDDDGFLDGIALFEKIKSGVKISSEEAKKAYPDRSLFSVVYKSVRDLKSNQADIDKLCMYTGFSQENTCKTLVATEALCELGILEKNAEGNPIIPKTTVRNEIDNSPLIQRLKRAMN